MTPKTVNSQSKKEKELKNRLYEFFPRTVICSDDKNQHRASSNIQCPPLERFGFQIRLRRKKAGINPLDFAERVGVDIETILAVEYGFASLDEIVFYLPKIAQALGIPFKTLKLFLNDLCNQTTAV